MFRFFRRPPPDSLEQETEDAAPPPAGENQEPHTEGARRLSPWRQRSLRTILIFGILAVGLGTVYFSWDRGGGEDFALPRLLPQGRTALTQEVPPLQGRPSSGTSEATSPSSTGETPSHGPDVPLGKQEPVPTFHMPLPRDPRGTPPGATGQESGAPGGRSYNELAEASHEAAVENLRAQTAELKLKRLKAELEADELRKNPQRPLRQESRAPDPKKKAADSSERQPRVSTALPTPGPIPAQRQVQPLVAQPAGPPAPPQMRVRIVTLEPKEAWLETGDGDNRGWFKVQEGQKLPDFVVTAIAEDGVTISFAGRSFFYPVGGYALRAQPAPLSLTWFASHRSRDRRLRCARCP